MKMTSSSSPPGNCLPQNFLRGGGTLADLEKLYGIKARRGVDTPTLVSLKYSMIDSPLGDPLVKQCRGLILDEARDWAIVGRPFDKFFNLGEPKAAQIDWSHAQVQEKLDGSLVIMYYYNNCWRIGTSGTPDASGEVGQAGASSQYTFNGLFWWLWNVLAYKRPDLQWRGWTFLFEMMTPYNRIVCKYGEDRIVFLGARENETGIELGADEFPIKLHGWKIVKTFPLRTIGEILETFKTMEPLKQEGYVVVDLEYNRVKVKHPGYVALHHLKGEGFTQKRILEVVRAGETQEILLNFPEWKNDFDKTSHAYAALIGELMFNYNQLKDIPVQKDFALEAVKSRCSGALFAVRSGKFPSIKDYLKAMNIETLLVILNTPPPRRCHGHDFRFSGDPSTSSLVCKWCGLDWKDSSNNHARRAM